MKYNDPDGRTLYVNGSKEYMAAVKSAFLQICSGAMVNFDTGEVSVTEVSKNVNPKGYELLSSLIKSEKTNII